MQLRPDIQITSMIKAMSDVILPAVDPNNKLAVEQSQLVIGMLSLMARQLPIQYRFDVDELGRLLDAARRMQAATTSAPAAASALTALSQAEKTGSEVLERCRLDPAELLGAIRALHSGLSGVVCALGGGDDTAAQVRAERVVLDMAKEQLIRDRAMLVMQGFERDPAAVPAIEKLLDEAI